MRLYDMTKEWLELMNMLENSETDEQTVLDTIEGLEFEIEEKADNYGKIIKEFEKDIAGYKAEEERLKVNRFVLENRIKWLKSNLYVCMKAINKSKLETDLFKFSIVANGGKQTLTIDGEVTEEYTKQIIENDTDKIRQALENGEELAFAHLEPRGESLRIK